MSSDDFNSPSLSVSDVRVATRRALAFQRYIFKKAWGLYYAIWASTFAVYFFLPTILSTAGLSPNLGNDYLLLVIDLAVSIAAGAASGRIIERARNAAFVRSAVQASPSIFERRKKLFAAWWIIYFSLMIGAAILFSAHLLSIVFGLATSGTLVFYYALKACFQERLPDEGLIAISVFGLAATVSFVLSLFNPSATFYALVWGITILVWFSASLYTLLHATEELVDSGALSR